MAVSPPAAPRQRPVEDQFGQRWLSGLDKFIIYFLLVLPKNQQKKRILIFFPLKIPFYKKVKKNISSKNQTLKNSCKNTKN
jgi:hypothetical protein